VLSTDLLAGEARRGISGGRHLLSYIDASRRRSGRHVRLTPLELLIRPFIVLMARTAKTPIGRVPASGRIASQQPRLHSDFRFSQSTAAVSAQLNMRALDRGGLPNRSIADHKPHSHVNYRTFEIQIS
jgi:hypothetical protein